MLEKIKDFWFDTMSTRSKVLVGADAVATTAALAMVRKDRKAFKNMQKAAAAMTAPTEEDVPPVVDPTEECAAQ